MLSPERALPKWSASHEATICQDRDGKTVACAYPGQVHVLHRGDRARDLLIQAPDVIRIALSPDGRWLATGTRQGTGVQVWDARTGRRLRDLPVRGGVHLAFSP